MTTQLFEHLEMTEIGRIGDRPEPAPATDCEVWFVRIVRAGHFPIALLSPEERARYERFRQDIDRNRFLAGCAMVRLFLGNRLGVESGTIAIDRTCPRCGADHGKPRLPGSGWHYSISHSGDFIAVAFSAGGEVGIDVELDGVHRSRDVWQAVLSPGELRVLDAVDATGRDRAFLRYWTRKEAALKATGRGLTVEPRLLEVSSPDEAPAVRAWPSELADVAEPSLSDLDFLPGHVAALALLGPFGGVHVVEIAPRPAQS